MEGWRIEDSFATQAGLEVNGVADGSRTRYLRSHNPVLYLVSYSHHQEAVARSDSIPEGLLLSVAMTRGSGRGGGIRTPDILLPKQARYQTALHPDYGGHRPRAARSVPALRGGSNAQQNGFPRCLISERIGAV
jgi:hypothetical protein